VAIEDDKVLTLEVVDNVAIVDAVFPVYVLIDDVYELNVVSSNLPVPIGLPFKYIEPVILTDPVNVASVLTSNPLFGDIEALTLPEMILLRFNPVTPLAGMLYKLEPSPLKDPLKDPVL
jgi:hypothetical protein